MIFTDGSCLGNPGRGGIGAVILEGGAVADTISQGYNRTTNNRMEMRACIEALKRYAKGDNQIEIWADSQYVVRGIKEWIPKWKKNGWRTVNKKAVKNLDLWKKLDTLNNENVSWDWVKGHANDEWNEMADTMATNASHRGPFQNDTLESFNSQ